MLQSLRNRFHLFYNTITGLACLLAFASAASAQAPAGALTDKLTGQVAGSSAVLTLTVANTLPPSSPAQTIPATATVTYTDPNTGGQDSVTSNTVTLAVAGVNDLLTPTFSISPLPASLAYRPAPGDATTVTWDSAHANYTLTGTLAAIDGGASEAKSFAFAVAPPTVQIGGASVQSQGTP